MDTVFLSLRCHELIKKNTIFENRGFIKYEIVYQTKYSITFKLYYNAVFFVISYEEIIKNNRRRVYYHLEPKGFELLQQLIDDYQKYTASIQSILNYK